MSEIHHFSYGYVTPVVAYLMSCMGSFLGLMCTSRAHGREGRARVGWLVLAAFSIGGTGIWVMHFIAILGFALPGHEIRYDVSVTLLSAAIAVVVVGFGLFVAVLGGARPGALLAAGLCTGLGVASMHYLGMSAMRMSATVSYRPALVGLSVIIAVVAATVALWFAVRVSGKAATLGAALVMGVAVSGMHYTGMAAIRVHATGGLETPSGAEAFDFLFPLIVGLTMVALILLIVTGLAPTGDEMIRERELMRSVAARRTEVVTPQVTERKLGDSRPGRWFGGPA